MARARKAGWLEAPGVPDGIKAAHVLAEGALCTIE